MSETIDQLRIALTLAEKERDECQRRMEDLSFDIRVLTKAVKERDKSLAELRRTISLHREAAAAQADDSSIWMLDTSATGAYLLVSLRWLHRVIERSDPDALAMIQRQARESGGFGG